MRQIRVGVVLVEVGSLSGGEWRVWIGGEVDVPNHAQYREREKEKNAKQRSERRGRNELLR